MLQSDSRGGKIIDRDDALQRYRTIRDQLNDRIVGQDEPKATLLSFIKNYITGVHDKNSPIGAFMATGPTGVGKTEIANVISRALFDSEPIRFDMNEFGEEGAKKRLIGVPPGQAGSEAGGQLTRALMGESLDEDPEEAVLLFDEIEKAHNKIYDIFLRIFDEGAYQDQNGTLVDCTNTFIILTSNVDQDVFLDNVESDRASQTNVAEDLKDEIRDENKARWQAVKDEFPTEFNNRLDDILYFDPLSEDDLMEIMDIKFRDFRNEIKDEHGLEVRITQTAKKFIIEQVYDILFGARPLDDGINKYIRRALSDFLLKNDSADTVVFKQEDGGIVAEATGESDSSERTLDDEDWMDDLDDL